MRNLRGIVENVRHGETMTPPRNRKSGNGNPSPTAERATILPDTLTRAGGGSKGEYRQHTVPVDSFEPNLWGLYNVHGNVWC